MTKNHLYLLSLIFLLYSCGPSADTNTPKVHFSENDYADSLHAKGGDTIPSVYTVIIAQMKYDPAVVTVKKGDTIVFVNQDNVKHDVTEFPDSTWTSKPLAKNASWKLVATKSEDYFCAIHPVMKGKIVVQ